MASFLMKFTVPVGDERLDVEVLVPFGIGGDISNVNVNKYSSGSIIKRNGEWFRLHINKGELAVDDVQIIGELIEEKIETQSE